MKNLYTVSSDDVPQILSLGWVYQLPFGQGKKIAGEQHRVCEQTDRQLAGLRDSVVLLGQATVHHNAKQSWRVPVQRAKFPDKAGKGLAGQFSNPYTDTYLNQSGWSCTRGKRRRTCLRKRSKGGCERPRVQVLQRGLLHLQGHLLRRGQVRPLRIRSRQRVQPGLLLPRGYELVSRTTGTANFRSHRQPVQHPEASAVRAANLLLDGLTRRAIRRGGFASYATIDWPWLGNVLSALGVGSIAVRRELPREAVSIAETESSSRLREAPAERSLSLS